jgi:glycine cleavage system H protein
VKPVSDVSAPVSGEIVEINEALSTAPEKLNSDPHGEAWLIKVRVTSQDEIKQLMTSEDYQTYVGAES